MMHPDLVPPEDLKGYSDGQINEFKTEYDVVSTLVEMGHEVHRLGVSDELKPIRQMVSKVKAHLVFNLLEEFKGQVNFDQNIVSYLEAIGVPYTGCNPRGLLLGRDKALSKKIVAYHRVRAPRFVVFPKGRRIRRPQRTSFPLIVKSLDADASIGISQASVVSDEERLIERVRFMHENIGTDAIAEEYIDGKDVYVGVLGNQRLTVLTPQELVFKSNIPNPPKIATERVKHNLAYQRKWGVDVRSVQGLTEEQLRRLQQQTKRIYRALEMSGYARIDYRLTTDGRPYFLEANPNPDLARYEELANAAEVSGISYEAMLQTILNLALRRNKR